MMLDVLAPVPTTLFVTLVVATMGQRLFELVRSRINQGTMRTHGFNRVDSSRSYVCMVVVHSTWFVAMLLEHAFFPRTLLGTMSWFALVVFVAAQMLRLWALRSLGSQWNVQVMAPDVPNDQLGKRGKTRVSSHVNVLVNVNVNVPETKSSSFRVHSRLRARARSRGYFGSEATGRVCLTSLGLVTVGPYRYVRHPNYLAVILEFLSLPIVGGAPITALVWSLLNGVVLFFRIQYEESHLARRPGYEQHLSTIPCLIPRLWIR